MLCENLQDPEYLLNLSPGRLLSQKLTVPVAPRSEQWERSTWVQAVSMDIV